MSTGSDHSCSGRSSSTSTSEKIISDGENSTSSVTTQSPTNNPLGLISNSESPSSQLFHFYRRQTPEEDLLSTLSGIDILVKQRQELVDKLVQHHRKLYRSNEIENLLKFSQQIDSIMRLRGFSIMPSPTSTTRARRRLALPPSNMERGVTIHDQKF